MIYRKSVKNAPNAQQDVVERVEKGEANPLCGFTTGTPAKPGFLRLQPKKMRQNL
jgi:hypothetical protein